MKLFTLLICTFLTCTLFSSDWPAYEKLTAQESDFIKTHGPVKVCVHYNFYPVDGELNGKISGFAGKIFELIGNQFNIQFIPVASSSHSDFYLNVQTKKCDIASMITPKHTNNTNVSNPVAYASFNIITNHQVSYLQSLSQMSDLTLYVQYESHHKYIKSHFPWLNVKFSSNTDQVMKEVRENPKAAYVVISFFSGKLIQKFGFNKYKISGVIPDLKITGVMGVQRDKPHLLSIINKGLSNLGEEKIEKAFNDFVIKEFTVQTGFKVSDIVTFSTVLALLIFILIMWNRSLYHEVRKRKSAQDKLAAIDRFRQMFIEYSDPFAMYDALRDDLLEMTNSKFGFIGEVLRDENDNKYLKCYSLSNISWNSETSKLYSEYKNIGFEFKALDNLFGRVITEQTVIISNQPKSDPRSKGLPEGHPPLHSFLGIPVMYGDKLVGEIGLANREDGYGQDIIDSLGPITNALGQIIMARQVREAKMVAEAEVAKINSELKVRVDEELGKQRKQEEQLIQQSKMAAMGEMISMIAHQWKQPLNAISLTSEEIDDVSVGEEGKKKLMKVQNTIYNEIRFLSQTIDNFRNFFRPSGKRVHFKACEMARQTYELIDAKMKALDVQFIIHDHECFEVTGLPNEFKQVLLNIFNNACDVFEERNVKNRVIEISFSKNQERGMIYIKDSGGGIPEQLLPSKIFDPYVTTKGEKGTGLGLQISKLIIHEKLQGELYAHNKDNGAEFVISLPFTAKCVTPLQGSNK